MTDIKGYNPATTPSNQLPMNKINSCTTFNTFSIDYPVLIRKRGKQKNKVQPYTVHYWLKVKGVVRFCNVFEDIACA